jgi:hypothetical protein
MLASGIAAGMQRLVRHEPGRGAGKRVQPVPANAGNGESVPPLARAIAG